MYSRLCLHLNFACSVPYIACAQFCAWHEFKFDRGPGKFKMSCEPGRKAAYSSDLRYRMVWWRIAITRNLSVSTATVHNICKRFELTGCVDPHKLDRANARVFSLYVEMLIIGLLMDNPSLYLGEICSKIAEITCIRVTPSTICRIIHRHGLTRKKIQQVALQRSPQHRGDFMAEMQFFSVDQNRVA